MRAEQRRKPVGVVVLAVLFAAGAGSGCGTPVPSESHESDDPPPSPTGIVAESAFRPTTTIEDIMRSMIDPAADGIWDAVVIDVSVDETTVTEPTTNEDWLVLRRHAVTLVESTNLLLIEGRAVAAAASRSEMPGVDLEPDEIASRVSNDRLSWTRLVGQLHDSAVEVLAAVEALDTEALLAAGDRLDLACESCHARFWYPGYESRPEALDSR